MQGTSPCLGPQSQLNQHGSFFLPLSFASSSSIPSSVLFLLNPFHWLPTPPLLLLFIPQSSLTPHHPLFLPPSSFYAPLSQPPSSLNSYSISVKVIIDIHPPPLQVPPTPLSQRTPYSPSLWTRSLFFSIILTRSHPDAHVTPLSRNSVLLRILFPDTPPPSGILLLLLLLRPFLPLLPVVCFMLDLLPLCFPHTVFLFLPQTQIFSICSHRPTP